MAILSKGVKLKAADVEITGLTAIPDLGGDPEQVEVTTLSDAAKQYIPGLIDYGSLDFEFIYETGADGNYAKLASYEEATEATAWTVELPDGSKFAFSGTCKRKFVGVGTNEALKFNLSIYLSSDVVFTEGAQ